MFIHVKITTDAPCDKVTVKNETALIVSVKEPAEQNRANKRLVQLVAGHFNVANNAVRIIIGHHSPSKILEIK